MVDIIKRDDTTNPMLDEPLANIEPVRIQSHYSRGTP
jgi:hypothetical protein